MLRAPEFWWHSEPTPAARLLAPLGVAVGAVASRRMDRAPLARLAVPVLCIGNPTVGGSGKTPVAIAVARLLAEEGDRPVFLTRGYGGRERGPLVVTDHSAAQVGDEALLLCRHAPTVVSRDRAAGGRLAQTLASVVVMDDGFQNPQLAKSWSALLVDRAAGLGNGLVTPAGPLRAPLAAQLPQADALVLVDGLEGSQTRSSLATDLAPGLPRYTATLVPSASEPVEGVRAVAFAGIGRPERFFLALERLGAKVCERHTFADHHPYSERDARRLLARAAATRARPATTAKDLVRLEAGSPAARELAANALRLDVEAHLCAGLREAIVTACRAGASRPTP